MCQQYIYSVYTVYIYMYACVSNSFVSMVKIFKFQIGMYIILFQIREENLKILLVIKIHKT